MFKEYIKPMLVLTVICLVLSAALACVYNATEPVVSQAAAERSFEAMYELIPEATGFTQAELNLSEDIAKIVREAYVSDNDTGIIFIAAGKGYSGDIVVMCAIGNDGKIIETRTLSHTETVGIGTIIEEESFLGQFTNADKNLEGVDTVTGATVSTSAYKRIISAVFEAYEQMDAGRS